MKKVYSILLILYMTLFNCGITAYAASDNIFMEGIYQTSNFSNLNGQYTIQNVSSSYDICVTVYDENSVLVQSLNLRPMSQKYNFLPLNEKYKVVIIGQGRAQIE
ncbi:MAG: hypothetical protein ACLSV2_12565 [Clostridium sp.]